MKQKTVALPLKVMMVICSILYTTSLFAQVTGKVVEEGTATILLILLFCTLLILVAQL